MDDASKVRTAVPLRQISDTVAERHRHIVVGRINDHEVKLAVNEDPSAWHSHPNSDEFFFTLEGSLEIQFRDGSKVELSAGEGLFVEAGAVHRTIPTGRTVNLLIEHKDVTTALEGVDAPPRPGSGAMDR